MSNSTPTTKNPSLSAMPAGSYPSGPEPAFAPPRRRLPPTDTPLRNSLALHLPNSSQQVLRETPTSSSQTDVGTVSVEDASSASAVLRTWETQACWPVTLVEHDQRAFIPAVPSLVRLGPQVLQMATRSINRPVGPFRKA